MTNRQIMQSALKKYVISDLLNKNFEGKYPDFKRVFDDYIELISFETNKWGGSFYVEASVVFPKSKNTNIISCSGAEENIESVNVSCTSERYRLNGMFDGWFYYSDVYMLKEKLGLFKPSKLIYDNAMNDDDVQRLNAMGFKIVQRFDENIAVKICNEINKQLVDAFIWMEKFKKQNR